MSLRLASSRLLVLLWSVGETSGSLVQPQQGQIQRVEDGHRSHGEDYLQDGGSRRPPRQLQFEQTPDGGGFGGDDDDDDDDGMMTAMPDVDWDTILASPESIINNLSAWEGKEWTVDSWQEFLNSATDAGATPGSVCPIVELAIGIGESFGTAGSCICVEDTNDDEISSNNFLEIQCSFDEVCLEDDDEEGTTMTDDDESSATLCASVGLNFTVEQGSGAVNADVCLDFQDNLLKNVCFSYQLQVGSDGTAAQSCSATYGGKPCECQMEDGCILVDCSAYIPFLKLEECQQLEYDTPEDVQSLIPQFQVFDGITDGELVYESIDWNSIDWNNIDWSHFGFDQVNWESMDWASLTWDSVFSSIADSADVCPILTQEVLGMDEELASSACTCSSSTSAGDGSGASGYNVQCSFENQGAGLAMVEDDVDTPARSVGGRRQMAPTEELYGDVVLNLGFEETVGSVQANLCVDFAEGIHPTTCIEYSIPIADLTSPPTCTATYGSEPCKCVIDENLCVTVDCSEYEATAVMDQCQNLSLSATADGEPTMLVPKFGVPSAAVTDVEEGTIDNSSGVSAPTTTRALFVAMGMVSLLVFALAV